MLMSLDTSTTSRGACFSRSACTTLKIWLSALPGGRPSGSPVDVDSGMVWKNRLPPASRWPVVSRRRPCAMSAPCAPASASSVRLAWRALRATSVMPFLWPSSSSSTIIGRKMSCSSKRNRLMGSCISTLVSSTNSLAGPVDFLRRGCGCGAGRLRAAGGGGSSTISAGSSSSTSSSSPPPWASKSSAACGRSITGAGPAASDFRAALCEERAGAS